MTVFLSSCVNSISEDIPEAGDTPIRIASEILCNNTRITDSNFTNNDAIGLFVLTQPKTIDQERYINNERLTCPDITNLEPDNELFYPKGEDVKCDFISYYPYSETGIQSGNSAMNISIQADQNEDDFYSLSDFTVANNKNVSPSENPVTLAFQHKLCKVQFILKIASDEKPEDLLTIDPKIIISGFHTQASYDFKTDLFDSFAEADVLEVHGSWEIENGILIGKEVILLPEPLTENHRIALNVNNNSYSCEFPNDFPLGSGNQHTITLNYSSSDGIKADSFDYSITRWGDGESGESTFEKNANSINIDDLKFNQVNLYKVMSNGTQVAEICKEYLLSNNIDEKAIVAYPYQDGKADLSKGTVLQFTESTGKAVGGSISWSSENALTYTPGSLSSIDNLYITPTHEIVFSTPAAPLPLWTERDVLTDIRGTEKTIYSIVKIGTQYWMTSNLNTEKYRNGTTISNLGNSVTDKPSFYASTYEKKNVRFYNEAAIRTGKLVPEGWKIPTKAEWKALSNYLQGDASLIKAGTWSASESTIYPSNNKSGFNGYPMGHFMKESEDSGKLIHGGVNQINSYWIGGDTENFVASTYFYLYCKNNKTTDDGSINSKALSIRCMRK